MQGAIPSGGWMARGGTVGHWDQDPRLRLAALLASSGYRGALAERATLARGSMWSDLHLYTAGDAVDWLALYLARLEILYLDWLALYLASMSTRAGSGRVGW